MITVIELQNFVKMILKIKNYNHGFIRADFYRIAICTQGILMQMVSESHSTVSYNILASMLQDLLRVNLT